jgi:hypothetical protein
MGLGANVCCMPFVSPAQALIFEGGWILVLIYRLTFMAVMA